MGAKLAGPYVGLSASSLRRLAAAGKAPQCYAIGGRRLWRKADLDLWVSSWGTTTKNADEHLLKYG
jgi:predicted DNA-binding transcriptional regulator AlpA